MKQQGRLAILPMAISMALLLAAPHARASLPDAARDSRWIRLESPNFVCYSNADEWVASKLMKDLEKLRAALSQSTVGFERPSPVPIYIIVFRDMDSFDPYNTRRQDEPGAAVGYFSAGETVDYLVAARSSGKGHREIIYHEFVHSQMHANMPGLPLWLNEGLAVFYSTFKSKGSTAEIGRPVDYYLDWLEREPLLRLKTLLVIGFGDPQYNQSKRRHTFYAESWALTHMLAIPEHGRAQFTEFLKAIQLGANGKTALDHVYGKARYDSLETALQVYLGERSFKSRKLQLTEELENVQVETSDVNRSELLVRLGDLQLRHRPARVPEAREHYKWALRLDESFAPAMVALGVIHEMAGEVREADSLFALAMQVDPLNAEAPLRAGKSLIKQRFEDGTVRSQSSTPAVIREARDLLSRSLELAPDQPATLLALGRTYLLEWGDSAAVGLWALQEASVYLPDSRDVLIPLVSLTARAGNRDGAIRIINEHLVPRRDRVAVELARGAVIDADIYFANQLAESGRDVEAVERMALASELAQNPAEKQRAQTSLDNLKNRSQGNKYVDMYNAGIAALNDQDFQSARERFEVVAAEAPIEELKTAAESRLVDIQFYLGLKRAGSLVQAGRISQARALIDSLDALPIRSEQRAALAEFRAALK